MTYFVLIDMGGFAYTVKKFTSLKEAYRFYLEDMVSRKITREVTVEPREIERK